MAAVLAVFWCLMMAGVFDRSATFDEPVYAAGGLAAWQLQDYRINPENGILPQRLAGLGLWGVALPSTDQPAFWQSDEWKIARQLFDLPGMDAAALLRGRIAMSLLALALALAVHLIARHLFGPGAGMLSLLLCVFCPGILANGPLMTADIAVTLFLLLAVWASWAALRKVTAYRLLSSGVLVGCALTAKMSGALVLPIGVALALLAALAPTDLAAADQPRSVWRRIALAMGVLVTQWAVAITVIWAFYGFRFTTMASAVSGRDVLGMSWGQIASGGMLSDVIETARRWHLLPEPFLYAFAFQSTLGPATLEHARPAFMHGQVCSLGWYGFFPYALLIKTPLSILFVLAIATAGGISIARSRGRLGQAVLRTSPLWLLLVVYGATAVASRLNSGHRHLLPLHGPLFVLAGAAWTARLGTLSAKAIRIAIVAAMVLLVAEVGLRSPNYLAYFNSLAGGPNRGWRHLVDSSLDWGQDLPALARAIENTAGDTYVSYYGSVNPRRHGIRSVLLPAFLGVGRVPALELEEQVPDEPSARTLLRASARWPEHEATGWLTHGDQRSLVLLKKQRYLRLTAGTYFISATMLQPLYYDQGVGAWREDFERRYRQLTALLAPVLPVGEKPQPQALLARYPAYELSRLVRELEWLRFARLTASLRTREPDDTIRGSILVFRVSEQELRRALDGEPHYGL